MRTSTILKGMLRMKYKREKKRTHLGRKSAKPEFNMSYNEVSKVGCTENPTMLLT